jgi:mevalonate kinase
LNDCLGNPLNESTLFEIALKAENRQHGRSSGVDIAICLKNAPIFFEKGDIVELNLKIPSFTLLSTGKPAATTGESVAHTTAVFQKKPKLLEAFALVTRELAKPQKEERFLSLIRENHALLKEIGVVPKRVSQLIEEIEHLGGAAKITGAGSVKGECAGAILVFKPKEREIDFQGKSE